MSQELPCHELPRAQRYTQEVDALTAVADPNLLDVEGLAVQKFTCVCVCVCVCVFVYCKSGYLTNIP